MLLPLGLLFSSLLKSGTSLWFSPLPLLRLLLGSCWGSEGLWELLKVQSWWKQAQRRGPAMGACLFMIHFHPCSDAFSCSEPPTPSKATCSSFSSGETPLLG